MEKPNSKFIYISSRKMYFYIAELLAKGYAEVLPKFRRWFITPLDLILIFRNNSEDFWYTDKREQYEKLASFYRDKPKELIKYRDAYAAESKKIFQKAADNFPRLSKLSKDELADNLRDLFFLLKANGQIITVVRRLDMHLTPGFRSAILKFTHGDAVAADKLIEEILVPPFESYALEERQAFKAGLQRLKKPYREADLTDFFKNHLKRYEWVTLSYYNEPPLSVSALRRRLKATEPDLTARERKKIPRLPAALERDAEILSFCSYFKDYARGKIAQIVWILEKYFCEISRRHHLGKARLKAMTSGELFALIKSGRKPSRRLLNQRLKRCLLFYGRLVFGGKAESKIRKYSLNFKVEADRREYRGRSACRGFVSGKALVAIGGPDKLKSCAKNAILITANTNPAFVPYLSKVAAIVAEEGGLTAHVSLISREFKIPSVVGVSGATKIFKDGDRVEVDADRGIVRKLNK